MTIKKLLEQYKNEYPIFSNLKLSKNEHIQKTISENLPPFLQFTAYIIEKFISEGKTRIGIVLPCDEVPLFPFFIANCLKTLKYIEAESADNLNILRSCKKGQHLRIGKATVEFLGLEGEKVRFKLGRTQNDSLESSYVIGSWVGMLEKTEGALSKSDTALSELSNIQKYAKTDAYKQNQAVLSMRSACNKTTIILAKKNSAKEELNQLLIENCFIDSLLAYGEIDSDSDKHFKLYNHGRLDCLPWITISSRLKDVVRLLKDNNFDYSKIDSLYILPDKIEEIFSNTDNFEFILKKNIPTIVFFNESSFRDFQYFIDCGFTFWHWKLSTLRNNSFKIPKASCNGSIYGELNSKINNALIADFDVICGKNEILTANLQFLKKLSFEIKEDSKLEIKQVLRSCWGLQNTFVRIPLFNEVNIEIITDLYNSTKEKWEQIQYLYKGLFVEQLLRNIFKNFNTLLVNKVDIKHELISTYIENNNKKKIVLIISGNSIDAERYKGYFFIKYPERDIKVYTLNKFYELPFEKKRDIDVLLVSWFEYSEYIHIKQSMCYKKLIFVLYDFENRWRKNLCSFIDTCLPYEDIKNSAKLANINITELSSKPIDLKDESEENSDIYKDISEYNFGSALIKSTISNNTNQNASDAIECIPVLLSNNKIGYFHPEHSIIEISRINDEDDAPSRIPAKELRKGYKILIRLSGRDIIKEKADELMHDANENNLRVKTESWYKILLQYSSGKSSSQVLRKLSEYGSTCTIQQIRYWLLGETIIPSEKETLIAIGQAAMKAENITEDVNAYMNTLDNIMEAGKKIQNYHRIAGRWLTKELKTKTSEIKVISESDSQTGVINGIGEVQIYTVEDILEKTFVTRSVINHVEDLY